MYMQTLVGRLGDDEVEQEEERAEEQHDHDDGIDHGGLDLLLDLVFVLDEVDEAFQDLGQGSGNLAGLEHAAVE